MGVPAHDERDFRFAKKYGLPIQVVVAPPGYSPGDSLDEAFLGQGVMINSGPFNDSQNVEGAERICDYLQELGLGQRKVQYRMRDWLISRQRYWGTPIPIVYCKECGEVVVPEDQLPVLLPHLDNFQPDGSGQSPLARVPEFVDTTCPKCEGPASREMDTMGGFVCSSWYFLRFTSPHYNLGPFNPQTMRYWMPVDLYVGGAEHAVMHLLYARFWTHFLAEEGLLPFKEPFPRLLNQGQMLGKDGMRMSKSRGNVVIPDTMVEKYGADTLRVYELFMAPFDQDVSWNDEGINGAHRFLNRIWKIYSEAYFASIDNQELDVGLERELNKLIREIGHRIETFRFNTLISILMEFVNLLAERFTSGTWRSRTYHQALDTLMILLAPVIPHMAEELWHLTGHQDSVHAQGWPAWDETLIEDEIIKIPIQVDGKLRTVIEVQAEASKVDVEAVAFAQSKVKQFTNNREVVDVIYVPHKILNILTRKM